MRLRVQFPGNRVEDVELIRRSRKGEVKIRENSGFERWVPKSWVLVDDLDNYSFEKLDEV